MSSNIIKLYPKNAARDPDVVLEKAQGCYESVVLIGWDKEGVLDPRASTNLTPAQVLWLLEVFRSKLVAGAYDAEE